MSCPNPLHAVNCPCDNDVVEDHDTTRCEGVSHVAGRLVWCQSTDDLVEGLCVACTARYREESERYFAAHPLLVVPPAEDDEKGAA